MSAGVGERLVTVVVTLAVPEAADPDDAAALLTVAADSAALVVVHAVGVEGHLPLPGATVLRADYEGPWLVESVGADGAVLRDLGGGTTRAPLVGLAPDPLDEDADTTEGSATTGEGAGDGAGGAAGEWAG